MSAERIWATGTAIFMVLAGIGLLANDNWENNRIKNCESRGNEWRVIRDQGWKAPIMGCVVIPPQSPRTPAKQ